MSKTGIENPVYNADSNDYESVGDEENEDDCFLNTFDINFEDTLEDLINDELGGQLDLKSLNNKKMKTNDLLVTWRNGPAPINEDSRILDIKLGSLEGTFNDDDSDFIIKKFKTQSITTEQGYEAAAAAYINYFSYLGSTDDSGSIDYFFLEHLMDSIDRNVKDKHGQSVMHEIAREWHTDAALFLKSNRVDIDAPDDYGRTPIFVAVAVNHYTMVEWLIENGANIHHKTMKGEGQVPMHYAAKYDSIECFELLLKHGSDPLRRDDQGKTAMFIAAEHGQQRMCKYLLDMELPVASYAVNGVSAIDHILSKLNESVALQALDQFITFDPRNKNANFYLSCLGKKRWRILNNSKSFLTKQIPPDPINILIEQKQLRLIMHPLFIKLLELKSAFFASKFFRLNILIHFIFTIIWTASLSIKHSEHRINDNTNITKMVLACIAQAIAFVFMFKLYVEISIKKSSFATEKKRLLLEIETSREFVHPRWPIDKIIIEKNEQICHRTSFSILADGWTLVEILTLLLSTVMFIIMITWFSKFGENEKYIEDAQEVSSAVFVLVLWIRVNRSLRYLQSLGAFIEMLSQCIVSTAQFAFLFFEFFIPFAAAFWLLFGGIRKDNPDGGEYVKFNDMLYQLYLLTIVGDYEYSPLKQIDKITSQILVGMYFFLVSIVSLNLYIALLSEAFARVNETASAIAYLKEAEEDLLIEQMFPEVKRNFDIYLNEYCAPLVTNFVNVHGDTMNVRSILANVSQSTKSMNQQLAAELKEMDEVMADLKIGENSMRQFTNDFDSNKIDKMCRRLDTVLQGQMTFLSKAQRKTKSTISKIIDFGVVKLEQINDLRSDDK